MLKTTKREEFLLNMTAYLMSGSDMEIGKKEKRTQKEVEDILNDKEKFLEIDIISDELDYFGLTIDSFEWK